MKYSNTIEYNINTKLDASGLTKLQSQIKQVELSLQRMGDKEFLNPDRVNNARKQLEGLNTSLTKSFNSSLGILDLSKLQKELQTAGVDVKGLNTAFSMAGAEGQAALNGLITQIGNFNGGIERTSSQIDKIFTTFSNTFRWGVISSFFSQFMNALHQSIDYVKELDDSLTQIMLVTDYNRDSMNEYAKSANEVAKALSMSTTGMTNASLVFAQQGYDLTQSQELATLSAKLANASQQDTATTSDQITAYMNAYGLENSIGELTQAMDNWALIANVSAADVGELAQASQRAASMANAVGVNGEQLASQIATIESVTREAPEQIGNGLKTLYARFSDIAADGEDEDGFTLGKVTSQLQAIGVQVFDKMGQIRDVGDIMEDLMVIWDDLDQTSKVAASQALAGKYQVNRFMALMDNSEMYRDYLGATGTAAAGTLDQMNQEYADSLAGRTQRLQTTFEGLFNDIFTTDTVYPLIDALTKLADGIDTVFKAIGDGPTILLTLASAFGQLFSTNIARSVNNMISNQQLQEVRRNNIANVGNVLDQLGLGDSEIGQYIKTMAQNAPKMNQEQYDQYMAALQDWSNTTTQLAAKEEELQGTLDVLNMVYGTKLKTPNAINTDDETGKISFTEAEEARANLSNKQLTALASKEDFVEETQQIMSLSKELGKTQTAYENFKSGLLDTDKALEMLDDSVIQAIDSLVDLNEAGILNDRTFEDIKETFLQVYEGFTKGTDNVEELEHNLDELIRRFVNLGEAASSMDPNAFKRFILSGIEQAKKQEQELQGLKTQDEQNKGTATGLIENIFSQNAIEGVIKVTSSLGELAGAITTVQNLGQILTDDDLGPMEKFVQILTGIGILIPTVLTSIKSMSDGIKALKEAQVIENTVLAAHQVLEITGLKIKQQNIIKDIENAASMKARMVAAAELAGADTALAAAETAAGAAATKLAGGLASVWAALGPIGIAIIGLSAVVLKYLWDATKEAEAQQKVLNELADQTQETANKLSETAPALNDLYDAYRKTGEASDEFKQSLINQAELLGINDAALYVSQGRYEDLKAKIDEATEAVYNNNAALQQIKLDKINPNDMANELSDDQKERYNVTYHQESGITGISGGAATEGQVTKIDQTPYELVKAAQQDIETQQGKINLLTQKRNDLIKEGLTATGDASQKITENINKIDEELATTAQKLAESKKFVEDYDDVVSAAETIRDNALNQELSDPNSVFKEGTYEEIEKFISAQEGVDSSNIDELIAKYAELAGNADAAAEAAAKLKENVEGTTDNSTFNLPKDNHRSEEKQQSVQKDLNLSNEEYQTYQNVLVNNNEHLQALSEEATYLEENAAALQQHREELQQETKTLQDEKDALVEKANNLKDNTSQYSKLYKEIKNYDKQIKKNQEELKKETKSAEDTQDQLEDLENKIIETAVGAKELSEAWKDNSAILRNSNSDWTERSEAINNLAPGLAHLLNMDLSEIEALPQTFWESTQNLDDMEAAINGNTEALQRLRGEAAQELLVKAGIDPSTDLYGEMSNIISMANAILPDLEAGAIINNAEFINGLNEMLIDTNRTAAEIEAIMDALDHLGIQVTQNGTSTMSIPRIDFSPISIDPGAGAVSGVIAAASSMIPQVSFESISVPNYEYRVGSGGSGFNGGANTGGGGGGGGGGRSCFVAGTLITTDASFKPIEQIQKGDIVLSYNERLGLNEYSEVFQTMIHNTIEPIYTLYIKDEQLRVTGIHRFLVTNKITCGVPQWVHAADLRVGQWVLFADGTWHVIHKIEVNIEHQTVYNFEVSHNHNYYVGRNQILAHNKGGGGGGGKKPKTIEPKEKKEHEKDYYEEVNSQLDKTEKILSRIEKEEDRLIGDKARANQNKQLSNLAKEIELQKEKQKIQQQELKDVDALMRKRTREAQKIAIDSGVGAAIPTAVYDEDGVIANYEQMSAAIDNVHNKLIDKYNAAAKAGNEELAKEIEKTIEKFDKYGEDLLNNAQRHNELQSEIEETTNALEELEDAMEDIRIEAFKAHQEAIDDLKDLREGAAELASLFRDFDEDGFLTRWSLDDTPIGDMVEAMYELDNIYTVTQEDANAFYQDIINKKRQDLANTTDADERAAIQSAISYFQGQQANLSSTDTLQNGLLGLANQDLDMLRGWIEGTNSEPNPFGENEAALWEAYQEAYDRSIELFKDWRETVRDLRDSIIDAYDEQEEAIEQHIDEYDRLLDHLERMNDTYSLYYGEDSYDGILAIMDQQGSTMQQQLNSLTTAYNYWQEQYEAAVANGDEKLIQEIREKMEDAEDAMYDKAEELAEHWVERYETAVDASIQKVDFQLWGGGPGQMDFEDQTMIWELQKDYISTYKDDVERAYEVDKLRSKYINLLNDAQGMSLQIQNKIRGQMQEQLDLLQNQGTMSEYDVKLANAKLEILQKQIALEDAQRNKNKMQLRRDTQGNYRYVYTANQGDVQKAQDELNESQYDAYEMTKEQTIANNDRAVSLYQDYMEKLRNIANKYKDDEVARAAALKALNEEYSKLLGALEEDFKDTTNGMYDVLTWMVENGTQDTATAAMDMLDQLYDKNGEVKENTGNDWRDFATHITTDVLPNVEKAVQEGIADINAEAFDLQTNMVGDDGVLTKIGSSVDTLGTSLDSIVEKTDSWTQAVTDLFNAFFADDRGIQDAMAQLEAMSQQLSENQTATSALSTRYNEANSALQASQAEAQHYQTALDFATGARSVREGTIVKLKKGTRVHYDRYGGKQQDEEGHTSWKLPKDMWVKFAKPISGVPLPYPFYATGESLKSFGGLKDPASDKRSGKAKTDYRHHQYWWFNKEELQRNVLDAMDTGGYTGEWNDQTSLYKNGKVALLHQKELVLNAMDTENILAAVSLMRDITKGSMMGLSSSISGFGTASSSYNPITEQRVEIQASFPNATDAEDIRQALIGLSDRAYQYAHRTI